MWVSCGPGIVVRVQCLDTAFGLNPLSQGSSTAKKIGLVGSKYGSGLRVASVEMSLEGLGSEVGVPVEECGAGVRIHKEILTWETAPKKRSHDTNGHEREVNINRSGALTS